MSPASGRMRTARINDHSVVSRARPFWCCLYGREYYSWLITDSADHTTLKSREIKLHLRDHCTYRSASSTCGNLSNQMHQNMASFLYHKPSYSGFQLLEVRFMCSWEWTLQMRWSDIELSTTIFKHPLYYDKPGPPRITYTSNLPRNPIPISFLDKASLKENNTQQL